MIRERDVLITDRVKEASMTKHRTSSVKFFGVNCALTMWPCKACSQFLTFHLKDDLHLDLAEI
ncbi:hypothetical protein DVH24_011165 [Malus domestica]|uniref:Uncharacterized protein n=1 Tax=Malus domestica TaxID=3750 RepID=A0A498JTP3_MALDO|nr:hypothetical protein DVH24_011165 [Malus domestica]